MTISYKRSPQVRRKSFAKPPDAVKKLYNFSNLAGRKKGYTKPYKVLGCAALIFVNVAISLDIKYYSAIYIAVVTWRTACFNVIHCRISSTVFLYKALLVLRIIRVRFKTNRYL